MTPAVPAQIALATLNHGAELDAVLCDTLHAAGAKIVYEASLQTLDFAALKDSGAQVVVVNLPLDQTAASRNNDLESDADEAADAAIDQLHAAGFDVVFNEVQDAAGASVEQRSRWVRHLVAKILHRPDFVLPPQPEGAPGIVSAAPRAVSIASSLAADAARPRSIPASAAKIDSPAPHLGAAADSSILSSQSAQDTLDHHHAGDDGAAASGDTPSAAPALSWLDAQAALDASTIEEDIAPAVETPNETQALTWRDVQDALEMHTAEDHGAAPEKILETAPAMSWQEAQDALDLQLLDTEEDDAATDRPHGEAAAEIPAEHTQEPDPPAVHASELVDWDKDFKLVDVDPSERPTLELPLPDELLQALSETLPEKAEAPVAHAETNVSAPDWGLVPLADEKPSEDVEKAFEAKAMYIPDAAHKKHHDFDLNDSDVRTPAESSKDKSP